MTQTEALKLALEALKEDRAWLETDAPTEVWEKNNEAITAIKAALEANEFNPDWDTQAVLVEEIQRMAKRIEELEAKDEPVACRACNGSGRMVRDPDIGTDQKCFACEGLGVFEDTTPPPVAEPHKRTWIGLTDEEIVLIVAECAASHQHTDIHFARAIEAKLRSKNYD